MVTDRRPARPPLAERALSERVLAVPPSGIRRFFDILATMDDVISLGVGEPDFDTPRVIVEAGVESLREGRTHYTSNFGTVELRADGVHVAAFREKQPAEVPGRINAGVYLLRREMLDRIPAGRCFAWARRATACRIARPRQAPIARRRRA